MHRVAASKRYRRDHACCTLSAEIVASIPPFAAHSMPMRRPTLPITIKVPQVTVPAAFDVLDAKVDKLWQPLRRSRALNRLFYTASEVGDFGMVWLAIGAAQAALGPQAQTRSALRLAAVLGFESILVNGVVKSFFLRERPVHEGERPIALRQPLTSSFPSGHTSSAVTAALLLTAGGTAWAPLYWAGAAVVGTSRVHVKIHHASDVIGGAVVGTALGLLARRIPLGG